MRYLDICKYLGAGVRCSMPSPPPRRNHSVRLTPQARTVNKRYLHNWSSSIDKPVTFLIVGSATPRGFLRGNNGTVKCRRRGTKWSEPDKVCEHMRMRFLGVCREFCLLHTV